MGKYKSIYTGQQIDSAIGKAHEHSDADFITDEERQKIANMEDIINEKISKIKPSSTIISGSSGNSITNEEREKLAALSNYDDSSIVKELTQLSNQVLVLQNKQERSNEKGNIENVDKFIINKSILDQNRLGSMNNGSIRPVKTFKLNSTKLK